MTLSASGIEPVCRIALMLAVSAKRGPAGVSRQGGTRKHKQQHHMLLLQQQWVHWPIAGWCLDTASCGTMPSFRHKLIHITHSCLASLSLLLLGAA